MLRLLGWAALTLIYAAVVESFTWGDLSAGALVSAAVLALVRPTGRPGAPAQSARRIAAAVPFFAAVAVEGVRGTLSMAAFVLRAGKRPPSGMIDIPLGARTELGVLASAWAVSLSPGSVLVRIDRDRRVMVCHFADASEPERARRRQAEMYEKYQRHVFP